MRDPDARLDRRVWTACAACPDGTGCPDCQDRRTCDQHWRFLLDNQGAQVFLQCPSCLHRWWHDTRFGAGGRPTGPAELLRFDPPPTGDTEAA